MNESEVYNEGYIAGYNQAEEDLILGIIKSLKQLHSNWKIIKKNNRNRLDNAVY